MLEKYDKIHSRLKKEDKMKKIISLTLSVMMMFTMLIGCANEDTTQDETVDTTQDETVDTEIDDEIIVLDPVDVSVACMSGPTGMGMTKFMSDAENGVEFANNYDFSIIVATDEVTAGLVKGDIDIAALPANLASVLYNNTEGGIQTVAINTLGVLYVLENGDTITDIESLRGQTIISAGKGGTPEMALRYVLSENGIDPDVDVTIEWKSEQAECLAYLTSTEGAIVMMPEPFVTTALSANENIQVKLDLTEEWDAIQVDAENPSSLITGVVVATTEFINENPEAVADFLVNYEASVDFTNENIEEAATLIGEYAIAPYETALVAIPNCNIVYVDGEEMQTSLEGYLTVLFNQNATSIGGVMPASDFYYVQQ